MGLCPESTPKKKINKEESELLRQRITEDYHVHL